MIARYGHAHIWRVTFISVVTHCEIIGKNLTSLLVTIFAYAAAIDQIPADSAAEAWSRCIIGNATSQVEKTPTHAVEIAFEACRELEVSGLENRSASRQTSPVEEDGNKLRSTIFADFVKQVEMDRSSDPEMHEPFADKVREDARRRGENISAAPRLTQRPKLNPKSPPAARAVSLSCAGWFNLMKRQVEFVFNIDEANRTLSGTEDGIHNVVGDARSTPSVFALTFRVGPMLHTAWINRDTGAMRVDLTNGTLFLQDNIQGQCHKYSGRKF